VQNVNVSHNIDDSQFPFLAQGRHPTSNRTSCHIERQKNVTLATDGTPHSTLCTRPSKTLFLRAPCWSWFVASLAVGRAALPLSTQDVGTTLPCLVCLLFEFLVENPFQCQHLHPISQCLVVNVFFESSGLAIEGQLHPFGNQNKIVHRYFFEFAALGSSEYVRTKE